MPALTSSTQTNPVLRDPDVRLMLRVRDGDDAAFNEIVVAYQSRLIGVLRHLVQDQSAAEDLARKCFCGFSVLGGVTSPPRSFRRGCSASPTIWR